MTTEIASNGKPDMLAEFDKAKALIAGKKEEYALLTADTSEGYKAVKNAIAVCRSARTSVEGRRKDLVDDAVKWQRDVNAKAKIVTTLIEEVEEPLKAKRDAVDNAKEIARIAAEKAERDRIEAEAKAIRDAELARIKAEQDKLAAERAEMERQRKEAQEAHDKKVREENERLEAAKAALDVLREEAVKYQREAAAKIKTEQDKLQAERDAIESEKRRKFDEETEARFARKREDREVAAKAESDKRFAEQEAMQAEIAEQRLINAKQDSLKEVNQVVSEWNEPADNKTEHDKLRAYASQIRSLHPPEVSSDAAKVIVSAAVIGLFDVAARICKALPPLQEEAEGEDEPYPWEQ